VDYIPSKKLEDFLKFPEPLTEFKNKFYTIQEFEQLVKSVDPISTKTVIFGCNKKIIKVMPQQPEILQYTAHNFHGLKDNVFLLVKNLTDQRLPPVNTEQDVTEVHRQFIEDFVMERLSNLEVIGFLKIV